MKVLLMVLVLFTAVSCAHKLNPNYSQHPDPDSVHRGGFGFGVAANR